MVLDATRDEPLGVVEAHVEPHGVITVHDYQGGHEDSPRNASQLGID